MQTILCMNAKGGCGKTTIATNLASWYATRGEQVALADFDPQQSAVDWAADRPTDAPPVPTVAAFEEGLRTVPSVSCSSSLSRLMKSSPVRIRPALP